MLILVHTGAHITGGADASVADGVGVPDRGRGSGADARHRVPTGRLLKPPDLYHHLASLKLEILAEIQGEGLRGQACHERARPNPHLYNLSPTILCIG